MLALWFVALVWTGGWTWLLWAGSGVYAAGPGIVFAIWLLPVLPLFLATPRWLRRRGRQGSFTLVAVLLAIAVLFFLVPFHLPREHFSGSESHTVVPFSLYLFMATLTIVPAASVVASLAQVASTRHHRALSPQPDA
jgi:hypothetical protein